MPDINKSDTSHNQDLTNRRRISSLKEELDPNTTRLKKKRVTFER